MKFLRGFSLILLGSWFVCSSVAQQPVVVSAASKELKRAAHHLRIPADQLKNARNALQEATDLVKKIDPRPTSQIFMIVQDWNQLDRSESKTVVDSFIQDLRSQAADCSNLSCYQSATSAAISLMQSNTDLDYEKQLQTVRNWPDPKFPADDSVKAFQDNMETQIKRQALSGLASTDPEKALALLSQSADPNTSAQVVQGLMNTGKKDLALQLVDQTISSFDPNTADARSIQNFQNFVQMTAMNLDSARSNTAVASLFSALMSQPAGGCGAAFKSADTSVALTCPESKIVNILQGFHMRPGFTVGVLNSVPSLKQKLDSIGGIDALYGASGVTLSYGTSPQMKTANVRGAAPGGGSALFQELKGKDPAYIKRKLKDVNIDVLISFATTTFYQDPDSASVALEMAQQLLPQVEPLQKRAMNLQSLIQAGRNIEGESDTALLKMGFVVADDLKREFSENIKSMGGINSNPAAFGPADQLEAFLIAELSRDSYDLAIQYVHSMEDSVLKVACLTQIAQALSQPNF